MTLQTEDGERGETETSRNWMLDLTPSLLVDADVIFTLSHDAVTCYR